jgi:polar amino acid transport system substrate-binding protein
MSVARVIAMAASAIALSVFSASAGDVCAAKTIKDGVLTPATGDPAYFPWVADNNPSGGKGFEAAVVYEVAARIGYPHDKVEWTVATFDEGIQPGPKNFDFSVAQYSITEERKKTIDFSAPYYTAATAVLVRKPTVEAGLKPELPALKKLQWGVAAGTTAGGILAKTVGPDKDPMMFNDTADVVQALKSGQIDATMLDLPTALYESAVEMDDGVVLGQFPTDNSEGLDQFGLVLEKGNPLVACVDKALESMKADGTLAKIEAEWLSSATGVPVIK